MKAVTFATFGGPEVLQISDKPAPSPGEGEVVVRVAAAAINPTDLLNLTGVRADLMKDLPPPYTAGMDFSGHVVSVGKEVSTVVAGQRVVGVVKPRRPEGGAQAEQLRVPAASVAPVNADTDLIAAATVPMNALTALLSLELLGLRPGQSLLITGATGMLGSLATQVALLDGLDVMANAREIDRPFLSSLGLTSFLPRDEGLEEALQSRYPAGVDGLIDGALISQKLSHLVRDGGGVVSPRTSYRIEDPRLKVDYVQVTSGLEDRAKITRIGQLLDGGKLTPRVAANGVFHFTEAVDAYRMAQQGGFRGRVVMTFES